MFLLPTLRGLGDGGNSELSAGDYEIVTELQMLPLKLISRRTSFRFKNARGRAAALMSIISSGILFSLLLCPLASADIGVVLLESIDVDASRITGSGHSAVYLSNICPATPVKLRLCGPDEQGSIISNYSNFKEDEKFEWNIVPLEVFMYGVTDPRNRPIFASRKIKTALEDEYREKHLKEVCDGKPCATKKYANWRYAVGAGFERSVYIFVIHTTTQQDLDLIADFNSRPNEDHFNGFTHNCANFTRDVINKYFPHAVRPDYINDFGMTSPKAVARSFAHYAARRPDDDYHVLHFGQLPGTIKRSNKNRAGTEQLFHAKKWVIPLAFLASHEILPAAFGSYILFGRFNPQKELERHPTSHATELEHEIKLAQAQKDGPLIAELKTESIQERADALGDSQIWAQYREKYDSLVREAMSEGIFGNAGWIGRVFKHLDRAGTPHVDKDGAVWMNLRENGQSRKVGLSATNIFSADSDFPMAYELMLARIHGELKSPSHSRESLVEFKDDWALLQQGHDRSAVAASVTGPN